MSNPLLSVVIPVFNVEKYLPECLDSVLNQKYENIEIIAIDDGSTDNSLNILKKYAKENSNITVLSQENSGPSVARNKGVKYAKGKYVHFLDADDFILPETYSSLIKMMMDNELDLIQFSAEPFLSGAKIEVDRNLYDSSHFFEIGKVYTKKEFLSVNLRAFNPSPCLYIVKRDVLINNKLLFKSGIYHEDELFTLELFLNIERSMYVPNRYYQRRYRKDSIMTSRSKEQEMKSFNSYSTVINEMNLLLEKYDNPSEIELIKKRMGSIYIGLLNKDIDKSIKRKRLAEIKVISKQRKIFLTLKNYALKFKRYLTNNK